MDKCRPCFVMSSLLTSDSEQPPTLLQYHCGESKTQRKCFLDEKRDGLVDENRIK